MYSPLKEEIQAKRPKIAISKTFHWDWDIALARLWRRLKTYGRPIGRLKRRPK
jgi:hypothetical protein